MAEEFGDLLFAMANLARHLKFDPEDALRAANAKFVRRFKAIEAGLAAQGRKPEDASLDEMEALWQEAKKAERVRLKDGYCDEVVLVTVPSIVGIDEQEQRQENPAGDGRSDQWAAPVRALSLPDAGGAVPAARATSALRSAALRPDAGAEPAAPRVPIVTMPNSSVAISGRSMSSVSSTHRFGREVLVHYEETALRR